MSEGTSYAEVDGLVLALLDGLVSVAERALRPAPETAAPMVDVRLEGRPGDRVACPFVVENRYDRLVEVAFRASPLVAPGRPEVPAPPVSFEPARLHLGAGASGVATAVVEVVPELVPGATYSTTVEMVGYEGRRLGVALTVREAEPTARRAGARTGAARRSRPTPAEDLRRAPSLLR